MEKIKSKIENRIIHTIFYLSDISEKRTDASDSNEFLQVSFHKIKKGHNPEPHIHNKITRESNITQESWLVFFGKIEIYLYDVDGKFLESRILSSGDGLITFAGGHTYKCLDDDTILYEFKLGPYLGKEKDKTTIKKG